MVLDDDGEELWSTKIDNDPVTLAAAIAKAGPNPEVVLEDTWGWYWAADVIAEAGGRVHVAHPLGIAGFENRRVKNDQIDARLLADLLRMGRLPEAWIAPGEVREQRMGAGNSVVDGTWCWSLPTSRSVLMRQRWLRAPGRLRMARSHAARASRPPTSPSSGHAAPR